MTEVRLLVACHKPTVAPVGPEFLPIEVGAALRAQHLGVQRDDDGADNISSKNSNYCELTGIYWAWKHLKADYIGSLHYRRLLDFGEGKRGAAAQVTYGDLYEALPNINIDSTDIAVMLREYDVLVPRPTPMKRDGVSASVYDQYGWYHNIRDLEYVADVIRDEYPHIAPALGTFDQMDGYCFNMFVMRTDVFNEYCEFLFNILAKFEREIDISYYDSYQSRVMGYLGERLTNIFLHYVQSLGTYRVRELQAVVIEHTDPLHFPFEPVSKTNNVATFELKNTISIRSGSRSHFLTAKSLAANPLLKKLRGFSRRA